MTPLARNTHRRCPQYTNYCLSDILVIGGLQPRFSAAEHRKYRACAATLQRITWSKHNSRTDQLCNRKGIEYCGLSPTAATDVRRGRPRVRADSGDMHERFHTCPARKHRDAPGGFYVDRLKCALFVFDVETDGIQGRGVK
jgi:hypothetical protein